VKLEGERVLMRLHLSNLDPWHTGLLYEAVVARARKEHLAGATVLTGIHGYVEHGRILGEGADGVRAERPVIVEIVDSEPAVEGFIGMLEPMLRGHAVRITLERAHVVHYRSGEASP
jgi:PII-like signaling protein